LWKTAKPFLEQWTAAQVGPRAAFRTVGERLPAWGEALPEIPGLMLELFRQGRQGGLKVQWEAAELNALSKQMRRNNQRLVYAIVGAAFILSAAVIYGLDGYQPVMWAGAPVWAWLLGGAGLAVLLKAWPSDRD
jgi:ubiquinone biosynthesis protein